SQATAGLGDPWTGGWRLNAPATVRVTSEGETRQLEPGSAGHGLAETRFVRSGDVVFVDVGGRSGPVRLAAPPDIGSAGRGGAGRGTGSAEVPAPMPGAVLAVHVRSGDTVEAGDRLVTLEAMKMEHVVSSTAAATVADVLVEPGAQVTRGQVLVVLAG